MRFLTFSVLALAGILQQGQAVGEVVRCYDACLHNHFFAETDHPGRLAELHKRLGIDLDAPEEKIAVTEKGLVTNPDLSTVVVGTAKYLPITSPRRNSGALSGRVIYLMAGHGWTYSSPGVWYTQRGITNSMIEDMGNQDQASIFADLALNAGAIVVPLRGLQRQRLEVVVDNDSPGVTFTGPAWQTSTSTIFYGTPGDVSYRFHSVVTGAATATARYPAAISASGFYPVYIWARSGPDRINQEFVVGHSGGTSSQRVNLRMVGGGWIYIGNYHFEAGGQAFVEITNSRDAGDPGSVIIADAVRFGNGMGSYVEGGLTSGKAREDESALYWAYESVGVHPSSPVEGLNSVSAPRELSEYLNRETEGTTRQRIYLSFHSNAGGGRGADGLFNSDPATPTVRNGNTSADSFLLATLTGQFTNRQMTAATNQAGNPFPAVWGKSGNGTNVYGSGGNDFTAYGEINNSLNPEMAVTIIETAFHDNATDALLMRDVRSRIAIAKANLNAVIDYFRQVDGGNGILPPEAPTAVSLTSNAEGRMTLRWTPPVAGQPAGIGGGAPERHAIWSSTNGLGFALLAEVNGAATASYEVTDAIAPGAVRHFRVTASNAGGESMASATVSGRRRTYPSRVLIVNGFDRNQVSQNLVQTEPAYLGSALAGGGSFDRVIPRHNNSLDYARLYTQGLAARNTSFDTAQNEDVIAGRVRLGDYRGVIWILGEESTTDRTFDAAEQALVTNYLAGGGALLVSGSELGWDLGRTAATAADKAFLSGVLRVTLASAADDDAGTYSLVAADATLFPALGTISFDNGTGGGYNVDFPDVLTPSGPGARALLNYSGGRGGAAMVGYDGSAGGGRVVVAGFPIESITSISAVSSVVPGALTFLGVGDDRSDVLNGWSLR